MFEELLDREKDWTAGMTREEEGEFEYGHIVRMGEARKLKKKNKSVQKATVLGVGILIGILMGLTFKWIEKF